MIAKSISDLPATYGCKSCGASKPAGEMVLVRLRRQGVLLLRPRCKACHNQRERGHRREWKRKYFRLWRARHPELNESYWRQRSAEHRQELNRRAYRRFKKHHAALLIQGRMRRHGMPVNLAEARDLVRTYGPAYPTRHGLTPAGLKECERIRSATRRTHTKFSMTEIRIMVYADGYYKKPAYQKLPYRSAAQRLQLWHARQRALKAMGNLQSGILNL